MPDQFSDDWPRVRDKETGAEVTVGAQWVADNPDLFDPLDKPGADHNGEPRSPKPRVNQRAESAPSATTTDGPTATTKEK